MEELCFVKYLGSIAEAVLFKMLGIGGLSSSFAR